MKTINIDGDLYKVSLPVLDDVVSLLDNHRITLSNSIFTADYDEGYLSVYVFQASGKKLSEAGSRVCKFIGKKEPGKPFQTHVNRFLGFQPCLIPLDKSGCEVNSQFWSDNPEFTRLNGGSVYVNGEVHNFKDKPYSLMFNQGAFSMGPSSGNKETTLSWIVYNQRLYCTAPIALMDIAHMVQLLGLDEE